MQTLNHGTHIGMPQRKSTNYPLWSVNIHVIQQSMTGYYLIIPIIGLHSMVYLGRDTGKSSGHVSPQHRPFCAWPFTGTHTHTKFGFCVSDTRPRDEQIYIEGWDYQDLYWDYNVFKTFNNTGKKRMIVGEYSHSAATGHLGMLHQTIFFY